MNYTYPVEEYINQLNAYRELNDRVFSPDDGDETILSELEARSRKKKEIAEITDLMIAEYVERFEKSPELLTAQDVLRLRSFFDKLNSTNFPLGLDAAISLRLAAILHDHYRRIGDSDEYVPALRQCASLYIYLFTYHGMRAYSVSPYRDECIEVAKRMNELSAEAKLDALKALSLSVFVQNDIDYDVLWLVDDLFTSAVGDIENLDDVYERLVMASYYNILSMFCRDMELKADAGVRDPEVKGRERLLRMYAFCSKRFEKVRTYGMDPNMFASCLLRARFFLGLITIDGFLARLDELQTAGETDPGPAAGVFFISQFNTTYINYLKWFSGKPEAVIRSIIKDRVRTRMPRMLSAVRAAESNTFNLYLLLFLQGASATGNFDDFEKITLEMTVYADKALYIHTEMVREISLAIFDHLIEKSPEVFEGVAHRGTDHIRTHKDEMRQLLSKCCMFHDIGKFYMLDIVENSMRRLTDDEFAIIRSHPANFDEIIPKEQALKDEQLCCIRDCAITHHLWHDGSRGYPPAKQTVNRPFADILAIADGLDAATDVYGRPYRKCKTLDELISEFRSGAGDHYGSDAVNALSDPAVYDKLQYLITEGRKKIYCRVYRQEKIIGAGKRPPE